MAFASNIILLLFYYLRPQDWVPGMSGFNMAKLAVAGGLIGLLQRSRDEPRWRLMGSPQEWLMAIFGAYVVITSSEPMTVLSDIGALVVFGFMALHTLTTEELLERYLRWWLGALAGIVFLATVTRMGWDICSSRQLLDSMGGRFCLQTYTMNNPNAVGHTLVVIFPFAYYLLFWKNSVISRVGGVLLMLVTASTVAATQSKGAYIAGAISFVGAYIFGRKLVLQIVVIFTALALAGSFVALLPRLEKGKGFGGDEGVQGRMMAWSMARTVTRTSSTGVGFKQFHAWIHWEGVMDDKATHSAFVRVGGDLGVTGLTLYVGMLLGCGRSLVQYRGLNDRMARCRGALVGLLLGLLVSGWMLDRAYYTEVFVLVGAVAAYHQLSILGRRQAAFDLLKANADANTVAVPAYGLPAAAAKSSSTMTIAKAAEDEEDPQLVEVTDVEKVKIPGLWTRLGLLDLGLAIAGGQCALQFWDYIMETIKP